MENQNQKKFWRIENNANSPEIMIYGDIAQEQSFYGEEITHTQFSKDLKALGDVENITVRINSGGGDTFSAYAIYNLLKDSQAKVTVKIDGWAASAATIIAMAGDTVEIPSNGIFMIHDPVTCLQGAYTKEDCDKQSEILTKVKQSIIECYALRTGKTHDELAEIMANETWMLGKEAVDMGFCDRLTTTAENSVLNYIGFDIRNHSKCPQKVRALYLDSVNIPKMTKLEAVKEPEISKKEHKIMDFSELKKEYPSFIEKIVKDERERIKMIDELSITGFETETYKAKFETGASPEMYAMQVQKLMKAQGQNFLNQREIDIEESKALEVGSAVCESETRTVKNEATEVYLNYKKKMGV